MVTPPSNVLGSAAHTVEADNESLNIIGWSIEDTEKALVAVRPRPRPLADVLGGRR